MKKYAFCPKELLNSPFLMVALLLLTTALTAAWYRDDTSRRAPLVAGYNWDKHPNALLVVYPLADACSTCNLSVSGWAEMGLERNLDVVIVSDKPHSEFDWLRKHFSSQFSTGRLSVMTGADKALLQHFSSGDKIGGVRIRDGRIVARQVGGTPPDHFFQSPKKEVKQ